MKQRILTSTLAIAVLIMVSSAAVAEPGNDIGTTKKTILDNGLTVITKEIHTAPVVYFSIWYKVGARNETTGITGISHALEHMMFKGSTKFPRAGESDELVRRIGGMGNAGTSTDYTVFYETVPTGMEDKVIDIESDRMSNALLRADDFASEIKVVMEERKMRNEDSAKGLFWEEINAAAFKVHPYGWPIVGWMNDLKAMKIEDLRKYYKSHYAPDNAIVVMCGDFNTEEAMKKISATFGKVARAETPAPKMNQVEPQQEVEKRIVYPSKKSNLAYVVYAYHAPTYGHPDSPALEIVDSILSSGRLSRLSQTFVESGLASSADAVHDTNTDPYLFYFEIELVPGVDTDLIEKKLAELIEDLKQNPVTEHELQKAKNRFIAEEVLSSQSISSYGRKLGWFDLTTGDPDFWDKYIKEINDVTADDVMNVAKKYFRPTNRTVGILIPEGNGAGMSSEKPEHNTGPRKEYAYTGAKHDEMPNAGTEIKPFASIAADGDTEFPGIDFASRVKKKVLSNGLTLLIYENPAFPVVVVNGVIRGGGSYSDPEDLSGLAKLTAATMRRGTKTRTYDEINEALEFVGASVELSAGNEASVFSGEFLKKDFSTGFELLSDILLNPSFPEDGFEIERNIAVAQYTAMQKNTRSMAWKKYMNMMYRGHPYSNPVDGSEAGLAAATVEAMKTFHDNNYRPENTIIAVAGDVTAAEAGQLAEKLLGKWERGGRKFNPPPVADLKGFSSETIDMPEKMQDVFVMGFRSPRPADDDYETFDMMTDILAGTDLTSRLYTTIREQEGLVYYVYGFDLAKTAAAAFQISGGVSPQNLNRAIELTKKEIARISEEPVGDEELADAKSYAVGHLPLTIETNSQIAKLLTSYEYHGRSFDDIDNYADKVNKITMDDIMNVARKYLVIDKCVLAVAGPEPGDIEK